MPASSASRASHVQACSSPCAAPACPAPAAKRCARARKDAEARARRPPPNASNSSCMPRQMPSTGWRSAGSSASRPARAGAASRRRRRRRRAGSRALAARMRAASAETSARTPRRSSANCSEAMLAPPLATIATSRGAHSTPLVLGSSRALAADRLPQAAADALEAGLDHVVACSRRARVRCSAAPSASASERKKCGTSSVGSSPTRSRPKRPSHTKYGAPDRVERDLGLGLVHRQQEAVARDAALVAKRLAQRRAERERAVLDGVMLIDAAGRPWHCSSSAKPPCLAICSSM